MQGEHWGELGWWAGGPAWGLAASIDLHCLWRAQHMGLPVGSGPWKKGISPLFCPRQCQDCGQGAVVLCPAAGPGSGHWCW